MKICWKFKFLKFWDRPLFDIREYAFKFNALICTYWIGISLAIGWIILWDAISVLWHIQQNVRLSWLQKHRNGFQFTTHEINFKKPVLFSFSNMHTCISCHVAVPLKNKFHRLSNFIMLNSKATEFACYPFPMCKKTQYQTSCWTYFCEWSSTSSCTFQSCWDTTISMAILIITRSFSFGLKWHLKGHWTSITSIFYI